MLTEQNGEDCTRERLRQGTHEKLGVVGDFFSSLQIIITKAFGEDNPAVLHKGYHSPREFPAFYHPLQEVRESLNFLVTHVSQRARDHGHQQESVQVSPHAALPGHNSRQQLQVEVTKVTRWRHFQWGNPLKANRHQPGAENIYRPAFQFIPRPKQHVLTFSIYRQHFSLPEILGFIAKWQICVEFVRGYVKTEPGRAEIRKSDVFCILRRGRWRPAQSARLLHSWLMGGGSLLALISLIPIKQTRQTITISCTVRCMLSTNIRVEYVMKTNLTVVERWGWSRSEICQIKVACRVELLQKRWLKKDILLQKRWLKKGGAHTSLSSLKEKGF